MVTMTQKEKWTSLKRIWKDIFVAAVFFLVNLKPIVPKVSLMLVLNLMLNDSKTSSNIQQFSHARKNTPDK